MTLGVTECNEGVMNILNVVYTFNSGGVERLVIDVSNRIVCQNQNSYVCIVSDKYSESLVRQFNHKVKLIFSKKKNRFRHISFLLQLNKIIRENHIQVMHVHEGNFMSFFLLLKIMNPSLKVFFTVHDTYIFSELSRKNRLIASFVCTKIIAISDAVRADILKNGVTQKKIIRIYNGVNFNRFDVEKRHKSELPIILTNVARFFPEKKGQDIFIRAAAILKSKGYDIKALFAGAPITNDGKAIKDMHKLCADMGVEEIISFLGNIDDIPKLLEQTDIFVIPSRYEGFGIAAVEALAMGIPCVASDIEGLNEVVNSSELGEVFAAGDEKELADKLEYVINYLHTYNPLLISENIKKRFSIESMVEQLITIYNT